MASLFIVLAIDGGVQPVPLARGAREPLGPGPGYAIYERRMQDGELKEALVTIVCSSEVILYAVTDDQLRAWKGQDLLARPMRVECRREL